MDWIRQLEKLENPFDASGFVTDGALHLQYLYCPIPRDDRFSANETLKKR